VRSGFCVDSIYHAYMNVAFMISSVGVVFSIFLGTGVFVLLLRGTGFGLVINGHVVGMYIVLVITLMASINVPMLININKI